jgi:hypothetical protein
VTRHAALVLASSVVLMLPATAQAERPDQAGSLLSNERTFTSWAHPVHDAAAIYTRPTSEARRITKTHQFTEDGFREVYLVLRSRIDSKEHTWLKVRIPMRPNGQKGWLRESALGPLYRVATRLVVDRSSQHATLYKRGHKIWSEPVGIGAPSTPTPPGNFWIREKFKTHAPGSLYGPAAFGTSDYSVLTDWPGGGVIGIHGTDEPALIPGRVSHGCIRVRNAAVARLYELMPIGTPLLVR